MPRQAFHPRRIRERPLSQTNGVSAHGDHYPAQSHQVRKHGGAGDAVHQQGRLGGRRHAQGRLHLSRPDRRFRLDLGAREGAQGNGRRAGRQGDRGLRRERRRRPERDARPARPRQSRPQADLRDVVRLHGPDAGGRQGIPGREIRALHRLQTRRQHGDLQQSLPSGPRRHGHDRRHDDQDRHDRLSRLVQGAGSGDGRERVRARRASDQAGHQGQAGDDQFLVRSGQGSGRHRDARPTSAATSSPPTPTARPRCKCWRRRSSMASARAPTCRALRRTPA